MSNEGGSYQRQGKKGRVWVPDVADTAQAEPAAPVAPKRKPAAKRARKRKA